LHTNIQAPPPPPYQRSCHTNRQPQIATARAKGEKIPDWAQEGKDKLDGFRDDAKSKFNAGLDKVHNSVDQADRTVEQKAAEAKGTVSGWFGGKK
jgi:hypothetical protein